MQLRSLKALNRRGSILDLPLEDISGGYKVRDIQGLGPVKATLVSSSFASLDGAQFHSSKREPRNLVIKLGLAPDLGVQSVHELRNQLYPWFMPQSEVYLTFSIFNKFTESVLDQVLDLSINGHVESCEPAIFTNDPELDISIMCFNPDFVDDNTVIFEGMTVSDTTEETLEYAGTVDTGCEFNIYPDRAMTGFTIYHQPESGEMNTVYYTDALQAGDVVTIGSVRGAKFVRRVRSGTIVSVLWAIAPQSAWLNLQPGDNSIRVHADGAPVPFDISYTAKYGGF